MGGASPLLSPARAAALAGLLVALALYEAFADRLPDLPDDWDVVVVALVLMPASFAVAWIALPLVRLRHLIAYALAFGPLALALFYADADGLFNSAKLMGLILLGFWFLELFHFLSWVVLIAVLIPAVDSISVWRGPTNYVVSEQPGLFDHISVSFRIPGESGSANIGPPDVLFFALFLATADRFRLRVGWTWIAMMGLLSLTLALAAWFDVRGLPALPAVCIGFLAPNIDLIWRQVRRGRRR